MAKDETLPAPCWRLLERLEDEGIPKDARDDVDRDALRVLEQRRYARVAYTVQRTWTGEIISEVGPTIVATKAGLAALAEHRLGVADDAEDELKPTKQQQPTKRQREQGDRRAKLAELLRDPGFAAEKRSTQAEQLGVDLSTLKRDLKALQGEGGA